MGCDDCPGGDNLVYKLYDGREISRQGNIVFLPRPTQPDEWCVKDATKAFQLNADPVPVGENSPLLTYNPATCSIQPADLSTLVCDPVEYDPALGGPPAGGCSADDLCLTPKYAINSATGCVTHVCIRGSWVCLGGTTPPPQQRVCYDLAAWTFPTCYSDGCGQWIVAGTDVMSSFVCAGGTTTGCLSMTSQFTTDYPWGTNVPQGSAISGYSYTGGPSGCGAEFSRPGGASPVYGSWLVRPNIPASDTGPITASFSVSHLISPPPQSGVVTVALWNSVTGAWITPTSVTGPPGTSTNTTSTHVEIQTWIAPADGTYDWDVTWTLPAGTDPSQVRMWISSVGGSEDEALTDLEFSWTAASGAAGCFCWGNVSQLVQWMNANDPLGNTWFVCGGKVCSDVTPGTESAYGTLEGCLQ